MGYTMKHGNSAVPFKELGSSPAKQNEDWRDEQSREAAKKRGDIVDLTRKSTIPMEPYEPSDEEIEVKEDAAGVTTNITTPPVMKSGSKNKAIYKGKVVQGWENPHAVKPKRN